MQIEGRFRLGTVSVEEAWLALSDPAVQETTLPGCRAVSPVPGSTDIDPGSIQPLAGSEPVLERVHIEELDDRAFAEGDRFATRVAVGIGPATHKFDAIVEIQERTFPVMRAKGTGVDDDGSFSVTAGMELSEQRQGTEVAWWLTADVGDRIGRVGRTLLDPVADRYVSRYVENLSQEIDALNGAK